MHLYEIGSAGLPIGEMVLFFASPLMKATSMDPISIKETFTIAYLWNSIRLVSNHFRWSPWIFFQSKQYPRRMNRWNRFPRKSYRQTLNFFFEFLICRFRSWGFSISEKSFFLVFTVIKQNLLWILVDRVDFHTFLIDEFIFNCFPYNEVQFRGFPMTEINIYGFSSMTSFSIGFQSFVLVFVDFPLTIGCLHGFSFA